MNKLPKQHLPKMLTTRLKLVSVFTTVVMLMVFSLLNFPNEVYAASSSVMNFQSKIVNKVDGMNVSNGSPSCVVGGGDSCDFRIGIYSESSGGVLLWRETHSNVEIGEVGGIINLSLNSICNSWSAPSGSCSGSGIVWGNDSSVYVEVEFDSDGNGDFVGGEVFSRKIVSSVPFAYYSDVAASLNGFNENGFVQFAPGTIQTTNSNNSVINIQTTGNVSSALINLNENGAGTPDLLNLAVGGTSRFRVGNDGTTSVGTITNSSFLNIAAATASKSSLRIESSAGVNPSTPNSGELWWNGTNLYFHNGVSSIDLLDSGTNSYIELQPSIAQSAGGTTTLIHLNEVGGGTPDLIDLRVGGVRQFGIDNGGNAYLGGNILPLDDNTYNLGSSTARWQEVYVGPNSLRIGVDGNDSSIGYDTTANQIEFDASGDGIPELVLSDAGNIKGIGTLETGNFASDPTTCNSTTNGEIYYNTTSSDYKYCNGTSWVSFTATGGNSGLYSISGSVVDGGFLELVHAQNTTNVVASGWKLNTSTNMKEAISARTGIVADWGTGADGSLSTSGIFNLNTSTSGSRTYADGIAYRVDPASISGATVSQYDTNSNFTNGLGVGDEVLLINLQGATGDTADVGNYEFLRIANLTSSTVTFTSNILNSYDGTTPANQSVVIQRVPNYINVNVNAGHSLTVSAWDGLNTIPTGAAGYTTGIIAFRATGTVTIAATGIIDASEKGFRPATSTLGSESIDGIANRGGATGPTGNSGSGGSGGTGNGGGGNGGGGRPACNAGGGGGGGGRGTPHTVPANASNVSKLYLGSGASLGSRGGNGGGSGSGDATCTTPGWGPGSGGAGGAAKYVLSAGAEPGGGIVLIYGANAINGGAIQANGGNGGSGGPGSNGGNSCCVAGGGGGGAGGRGGTGGTGGSVLLRSYDTIAGITVTGGVGGGGGASGTGGTGGSLGGTAGTNGASAGGAAGAAGFTSNLTITPVTEVNEYAIVVVDANRVRLYNYTGQTHSLELAIVVNGAGADFAENFLTHNRSLRIGELVAVSKDHDLSVDKTTKLNQSSYVGIVSTAPGSLIGGKYGETRENITPASLLAQEKNRKLVEEGLAKVVPVALEGKVPVRITNENGGIQRGDKLTVSSRIAGMATKYKGEGPIIGIAMEEYQGNGDNDLISVLLTREGLGMHSSPLINNSILIPGVMLVAVFLINKLIQNYRTQQRYKWATIPKPKSQSYSRNSSL